MPPPLTPLVRSAGRGERRGGAGARADVGGGRGVAPGGVRTFRGGVRVRGPRGDAARPNEGASAALIVSSHWNENMLTPLPRLAPAAGIC
eukprot:357579-Prorocentrum_minimum.AAC.1